MGKFTYMAMSIIFAFFLTTMLLNSMYEASTDTTKKEFISYEDREMSSDLENLTIGNQSIQNNENSMSNMQYAAQVLASNIANSYNSWSSKNFEDKILGAFGLISAMTIDVGGLLIAIFVDGIYFISGIGSNLTSLPPEFDTFIRLSGLGIALFTVYIVFKVASIIIGREI